jgi:TolB-like protein/class 3 adenylate cyclase
MTSNLDRVERKLAAILAADVAGYARLMGADEGRTLRALIAHREIMDQVITDHGGRIANTAGDSVLAEFSSVVDAVECAVLIQQKFADANLGILDQEALRFRIGIHVGDVMVRGRDLLGDGVNIAARVQALAQPGTILVSEDVFRHVAGKVTHPFKDSGEHLLKNIARPLRVYACNLSAGQLLDKACPDRRTAPTAVLRTEGDQASLGGQLPVPERPSVAVLPFQNMSGDPEQDYFADGIVEDITTELSRLRWLFVIARNSSFTYKGRAVDVKQVGRELGVRYVLEGSVRKAGNRVRITGQLIDASTGAHLWADRFDGELADIFELQDHVTASVVGAIAPKLEQAEIERATRKPTQNLDAYDYYLRGMAVFHQFSRPSNTEALALFSRAIELDPKYASAYGMAARCYLQRKGFGWVQDSESEVAEAERLARRAAELGKDDAVALCAAGFTLIVVVGDLRDGPAYIDRSLVLNPNLGWAWHVSALTKALLGEPEAALEHAARGMRLSPQDPQMAGMQVAGAFAHFFAGRDEDAFSLAEAALRNQPNFFMASCMLAASGALAGKQSEAERAMERVHQMNPSLRLSNLKNLIPIRRSQDFERWEEGLRKAGLSL